MRPALKRFASGRRWKTLTKPDVEPKNVFVFAVSTLSCWTVAVTPRRSHGWTSAYPNVKAPPRVRRAKSGKTRRLS